MNIRDVIGERGEAIFRVLMTRKHPERGYLFDHPRFLGDKKRTVDFLVELFHDESLIPFFFVQVKSTAVGYTQQEGRLRVQVTSTEMRRLRAYSVPTYIVGIDERQESGYLLSANAASTATLSSLPTHYPLSPENLALLWDEVAAYWAVPRYTEFQSTFRDLRWGT